jgi:hypothetical protein
MPRRVIWSTQKFWVGDDGVSIGLPSYRMLAVA